MHNKLNLQIIATTACLIFAWQSLSSLATQAFGAQQPDAYAAADTKPLPQGDRARTLAERRRFKAQMQLPLGLRMERNIHYVPGSTSAAQTMDLFVPPTSQARLLPVVVWIHGGGWRYGDKPSHIFIPLLHRGIAVAAINYRLTTESIWPAQIYDCKAAVRFLRAHASEFGLDGNEIGVWGESAGGHLAALLGTTGGVEALEGKEGNIRVSSEVQAVCDWFGPTDLTNLMQEQKSAAVEHAVGNPDKMPDTKDFVEWLLGGPVAQHLAAAKQASPLTYVSALRGPAPAFLIVHGDKDKNVPVQQSRALYDALKLKHVDACLQIVPGGGHGRPGFGAEMRDNVVSFFESHLGRQSK